MHRFAGWIVRFPPRCRARLFSSRNLRTEAEPALDTMRLISRLYCAGGTSIQSGMTAYPEAAQVAFRSALTSSRISWGALVAQVVPALAPTAAPEAVTAGFAVVPEDLLSIPANPNGVSPIYTSSSISI